MVPTTCHQHPTTYGQISAAWAPCPLERLEGSLDVDVNILSLSNLSWLPSSSAWWTLDMRHTLQAHHPLVTQSQSD